MGSLGPGEYLEGQTTLPPRALSLTTGPKAQGNQPGTKPGAPNLQTMSPNSSLYDLLSLGYSIQPMLSFPEVAVNGVCLCTQQSSAQPRPVPFLMPGTTSTRHFAFRKLMAQLGRRVLSTYIRLLFHLCKEERKHRATPDACLSAPCPTAMLRSFSPQCPLCELQSHVILLSCAGNFFLCL